MTLVLQSLLTDTAVRSDVAFKRLFRLRSWLRYADAYAGLALLFWLPHLSGQTPAQAADRDRAAAAFEAIVPVLRHPRCMNCHSTGDFPRQGNDGHRHTMQVRRGPEGQGVEPVKCSTCHMDRNAVGLHTPPGAPGWELPPPKMPMIWEGLSDRQLCELFKDPKRNGHRSPEQIVEHMHTPLVLWGWHPGEGRAPVPMSRQQFLEKVGEWASSGAFCPSR